MFRPIIIDPIALQITLVVASLLAISIWQKLRTATGIVIAVYAIYMISFISANSKLKTSQPIRLASHQYNKELDKLNTPLNLNYSKDSKIVKAEKIMDTNIDENFSGPSISDNINTNQENIVTPIANDKNIISKDIPFKVLKMKTGTSVINRSIVDENNAFTTDVERVYFLSGVQNQNESKILFHKWYHKGRLKSKIKMESRKSYNWRSWSYITVNPQKVGDWQVVIEDQGGMRYDSLSFVINDYNI
tara:strand:+ start:1457 stop:2197 length:741 start_codon:yes stop_codon:yes gene_type:complete